MNDQSARLLGVAFSNGQPAGLEELGAAKKYCGFVGRARRGNSFCVRAENISCPLARFHLGIDERAGSDLARTLVSWADAVDVETGGAFLDDARRLQRDFSHITFLPYPNPSVAPEVLIRVCSADEAQNFVQRWAARTGSRALSPVSGIGAVCGECTSYVLKEHSPIISLGCNGSRPRLDLQPEELLLAASTDSVMGKLIRKHP